MMKRWLHRWAPLALVALMLQVALVGALRPALTADSAPAATRLADVDRARLATVARQAAVVARGRVTDQVSEWSADGRTIQTVTTVALHYAVAGAGLSATPLVRVRTEGGFLPAEGLGMRSSHAPVLRMHEEVLLFLQRAGDEFVVAREEHGKFSVYAGVAANGALRVQIPLGALYAEILDARAAIDADAVLPLDWLRLEPAPGEVHASAPDDFVYENLRWPGANPVVRFRVNPNSPQAGSANGSVAAFRTALVNPALTWSVAPNASFTLLYDGPTSSTSLDYDGVNEVIFLAAGPNNVAGRASIWFNQSRTILEADFWLNADLDWDATGSPEFNQLDVESAAVHEFGHWLGLGHDTNPDAVMYASLNTGALRRALHPSDLAGISYIYPCDAPPCIHEAYLEETPTPTFTATASETPTPTSTAPASATLSPTTTPAETPTATATPSPTPTLDSAERPTLAPTLPPTAMAPGRSYRTLLPLVQR